MAAPVAPPVAAVQAALAAKLARMEHPMDNALWHPMNQTQEAAHAVSGQAMSELSRRLLYGLSLGHAVKHFGQGAVLILVPEVKATLALSDVAVGAMFGARDAASGVANVPAGLLTDMYRHRVPLLLMISMALVGAPGRIRRGSVLAPASRTKKLASLPATSHVCGE